MPFSVSTCLSSFDGEKGKVSGYDRLLKKPQVSGRQGEKRRKNAVYWRASERFEVFFNAVSRFLSFFQQSDKRSVAILAGLVLGMGVVESGSAEGVKRHTWKELRDRHVIKQQADYSCAAAAMATLLTYYYQDETTELEILEALQKLLTEEELARRKARGFTLYDLKRVAEGRGYRAAGFTITPEQLQFLAAPVIVYIEPMGYEHFAVLRGVSGGTVYVADPSRGNLRMSMGRFLSEWNGVIFVLGRRGEELMYYYPLAVPASPLTRPELSGISRAIEQNLSSSLQRPFLVQQMPRVIPRP